MATPDFVLDLRRLIGHTPLWLPGCTAIVTRKSGDVHEENSLHSLEGNTEILVVRRSDNAQWTPVTGIIDPGEEPAVAAVREVREESDIVAIPRRLLSVEVVGPITYPNGDVSSYVDIAFHLEWVSGTPYPADGENTEALFVPVSDLPPMNERFMRTVKKALSGETFADFQVK